MDNVQRNKIQKCATEFESPKTMLTAATEFILAKEQKTADRVSIGDTAITTVSVPDPRSYVVACLK
jgi:hypothetical protein